jgi:peptidoglycan/xylan/chitin deacetylase (PgdA/CDA1 family)
MTRARMTLLGAIALVLMIFTLAAASMWIGLANSTYIFEGVEGPPGQDHIRAPQPATIAQFDHGSPHRLAVLVTDPKSSWLSLARAFKAQGIPFTITQDWRRALQHKVVLVYPIISGKTLDADALRALSEHVHDGGTLLGFDLEGGGLGPVFGAGPAIPSRTRIELHWAAPAKFPEEQVSRFSSTKAIQLGSFAYEPRGADVIARYEDGGAGILCHHTGGTACLMGVDLGALGERAADGRAEPIARTYVNAYEPSFDVLMRWVRDLYVAGEPMPWLIDAAPDGYDVSLVFTHDIDFTRSVINARVYADLEKAEGVKATYFMQTKYVKDYNDDVFMTKETIPHLLYLRDLGMEIASHTVAHSQVMNVFPIGDGREHYPHYRPFVRTHTSATGGTVFGEARVSKFLIEHFTGVHVRSFRPGHLSYPFKLPEVLEATGYEFSSSNTANASLTHLPHQLSFARAGKALSPVYEFPITIEDEKPPRMGDRVDAGDLVIRKIAANHGLVVVLIHPNITGHKLQFERDIIARWKGRAWMTDLETFGTWWRARDEAEFDVTSDEGGWALTARAPEALQNVVVILPKAQGAAKGGFYTQAKGRLVISSLKGEAKIPLGRQ